MDIARDAGGRYAPLYGRGTGALLLLVVAAALLAYARFLYEHALNVPYHDDIIDVLDFLVRFTDAHAWGERLSILFEQYNDHRTAASRLVYWLVYRVEGEADFRTLCFMANVSIPVLLILYAAIASPGERLAAMAIAALILCQPRGRDFLIWPMSVFAFHGVIVYGFACLVMLRELRPRRFALAALLGVCATFSLSSGQFVWAFGAAMIAHAGLRGEQHAAVYLASWVLVAITMLLVFHAGFHNPNPLVRLLEFALASPGGHVTYFLAMLGSALAFGNLPAAIVLGSCSLAVLVALSRIALGRNLRVPVFFSWYLVSSVAAITLGRAPFSPLDYALDPRYSVASVNLLATLALIGLSLLPARRPSHWLFMLVLAAGFCYGSYRFYTPMVDAVVRERATAFDTGNYWVFGYPMDKTNGIVNAAVQRGIYAPPVRPLLPMLSVPESQ